MRLTTNTAQADDRHGQNRNAFSRQANAFSLDTGELERQRNG
jgi:hypothetical protein